MRGYESSIRRQLGLPPSAWEEAVRWEVRVILRHLDRRPEGDYSYMNATFLILLFGHGHGSLLAKPKLRSLWAINKPTEELPATLADGLDTICHLRTLGHKWEFRICKPNKDGFQSVGRVHTLDIRKTQARQCIFDLTNPPRSRIPRKLSTRTLAPRDIMRQLSQEINGASGSSLARARLRALVEDRHVSKSGKKRRRSLALIHEPRKRSRLSESLTFAEEEHGEAEDKKS